MISAITSLLGIGAEIGISSLFTNIAATATTKVGSKLFDKVCIGVGTFALSAMVGEKANNYIQKKGEELEKQLSTVIESQEVKEDGGEVSE